MLLGWLAVLGVLTVAASWVPAGVVGGVAGLGWEAFF